MSKIFGLVFVGLVGMGLSEANVDGSYFITAIVALVTYAIVEYYERNFQQKEIELPIGEINSEVFQKYLFHLKEARKNINYFIYIFAIALFVVIFGKFFINLDAYFASKPSFNLEAGGACQASERAHEDFSQIVSKSYDRTAFSTETEFSRFKESQKLSKDLLDNYITKCSEERANQFEKSSDKIGYFLSDTDFWSLLLLRGAVIAFVLFAMIFFIRNYQYNMMLSNKYFATYYSSRGEISNLKQIRDFAKLFDASEIKMGTLRTAPAEGVASMPRELMKYIKELIRQENPGKMSSKITTEEQN